MALLHACLLAIAFLLTLPFKREHRTIAFVLGGSCGSAIGALIADCVAAPWEASIAFGLAPAALVAWGAWGFRGFQWWPLAAIAQVCAETCALATWSRLGLTQEHLGFAFATAWCLAAWIGLLALRQIARRVLHGHDPGQTSRLTLLALLTSLLPEAFSWIAWGRQVAGGFVLASVVTCCSLVVVVFAQTREMAAQWRSSRTHLRLP